MSSKNERILAEMVRIGKVASVDDKGCARVIFEDRNNLMSDFLPVVSSSAGGSVARYTPEINDRVLCLYAPMLNKGVGQGFILGTFGKYPSDDDGGENE